MTRTTKQRAKRIFRDWFPSVCLVALLLVARSTLADHYHVPSGSMEHALQPGDHVVVNKMAYGLRIPFTKQVVAFDAEPRRGDVVVFDSPTEDKRLIKRVVAVGGDVVAVREGRVMLNGEWLVTSDPTVEHMGDHEVRLNLARGGGPDLESFRVPEGEVLVLGDYRGNSVDGRVFGTVPKSELYGRASGIFWRTSTGPLWQAL
jgi:signal peptidase I